MGRIFEVRKASMFARWDKMAKNFTRIGKEINIAVKAGGPDVATNPALRRCFQNARSVGMPKDRVEAAIKRAMAQARENALNKGYDIGNPNGSLQGLHETKMALDQEINTVKAKLERDQGGATSAELDGLKAAKDRLLGSAPLIIN